MSTLRSGIIVYWSSLIMMLSACSNTGSDGTRSILIFSKTEGYRHSSIETGREAITRMAKKKGYEIATSEDASIFTEDGLDDFSIIIFLNTTGDILDDSQQKAFEHFIRSGGGFIGIHAAADTEYKWPWYGKLVGGYFDGHPNDPNVRQAVIRKQSVHEITREIPDDWQRSDEWYNYKDINEDIRVLLALDESSYDGGTMGGDHPITWYHDYDGGRAFYTGMGHTDETFSEPLFMKMIENAIEYVDGS